MSHYHLSYDAINCKKHFNDDYDEAKRYLLCTILSIPHQYLKSLGSLCESTLLIELVNDDSDRLFKYLKENLSTYFYFVITRIAITNGEHEIEHNENKTLMDNFKNTFNKTVCNNLLQEIKTQY